jgi:hypothetical protein
MAVEMTLDKCVQKLRQRIVVESWEARRASNTERAEEDNATKETLGSRVPSFYTSPSLVNFSGLNVGDQDFLNEWDSQTKCQTSESSRPDASFGSMPLGEEFNPGWGGMGLRGNFSGGSLVRQNSMGSGLFVMDNSDDEGEAEIDQHPAIASQPRVRKHSSLHDLRSRANKSCKKNYIKTTNMANFYYRKFQSHDNLKEQDDGNYNCHDKDGR